jgi:hypothetical protein
MLRRDAMRRGHTGITMHTMQMEMAPPKQQCREPSQGDTRGNRGTEAKRGERNTRRTTATRRKNGRGRRCRKGGARVGNV